MIIIGVDDLDLISTGTAEPKQPSLSQNIAYVEQELMNMWRSILTRFALVEHCMVML